MRIAKVSGAVSYMDLFGAGLVKYFEERALAPVIGNGSFKSGAIKLVAGVLARKFLPRGVINNSVSLGFGVDGTEDILMGLLGGMAGAGGRGGENW
jgi:hypothetical protein